jgi:hypothetical protein
LAAGSARTQNTGDKIAGATRPDAGRNRVAAIGPRMRELARRQAKLYGLKLS